MNQLRRWLLTLPLCMSLMGSVAFAAPADNREDRTHRYYDEEHKDYHNWNTAEQHHWRSYWTNERRPYVSWNRANDSQRRAYWHWRHEQEVRRVRQ